MADAQREAWITGIGIVSCLGEGADAHWQGLSERRANVERRDVRALSRPSARAARFRQADPEEGRPAPDGSRGSASAPTPPGSRSTDAGVKGNAELLGRMDMIVAAGGGERDVAVDAAILTGRRKAADPDAFLNERLMSDLRPTLFLAQLSNLLAGNISIVHGVTGSSRTFMGEEAAGVDAVRIALARIAAGQSEHLRWSAARTTASAGPAAALRVPADTSCEAQFRPVWERGRRGRLRARLARRLPGAGSRAACRGARRQAAGAARGRRCRSARAGRRSASRPTLERMWQSLAPRLAAGRRAVISGATGAEPATGEERALLASLPGVPVRATGSAARPWRRAAIRHEHRARRAGAQSR